MTKNNFQKIILLLILTVLLTSGFSCKLLPQTTPPAALTKAVTLNYWGVWNSSDDFKEVIADWQKDHPNVKIVYKKLRYEEYRQKLIEGWAADTGPDIFSVPAAWLNEFTTYLAPQPDSLKLAFRQTTKTLGKTETTEVTKPVPIFSTVDIQNKFVDVVKSDVIIGGKVYGLPLSMDSLVLYYNRDLFNKAGIATPPTSWTELKDDVKKINQVDSRGNIITSGIALGTSNNIANAVDIASLLMMQNGTMMVNGNASGINLPSSQNQSVLPAAQALSFYTAFSDPQNEAYSWNISQPDSLEAFVSGKLAMFLGYNYHLATIKGRAPKLNLGIAPVPQIANNAAVNYTNYWVETVAKKSKNSDLAWGFINFMAAENEVNKYLKKTGQASALRTIIASEQQDPNLQVFANQSLTAARWYRGKNYAGMVSAFSQLIDAFPKTVETNRLLNTYAGLISQTLR